MYFTGNWRKISRMISSLNSTWWWRWIWSPILINQLFLLSKLRDFIWVRGYVPTNKYELILIAYRIYKSAEFFLLQNPVYSLIPCCRGVYSRVSRTSTVLFAGSKSTFKWNMTAAQLINYSQERLFDKSNHQFFVIYLVQFFILPMFCWLRIILTLIILLILCYLLL